jgi:hypothetical protein
LGLHFHFGKKLLLSEQKASNPIFNSKKIGPPILFP